MSQTALLDLIFGGNENWKPLPPVKTISDPFAVATNSALEATEAAISAFLARAGTVTLERWAEASDFPPSGLKMGIGNSYWALLGLLGSPAATHSLLRDLLEEELNTRSHCRAVEMEAEAAHETRELFEVAP